MKTRVYGCWRILSSLRQQLPFHFIVTVLAHSVYVASFELSPCCYMVCPQGHGEETHSRVAAKLKRNRMMKTGAYFD